MRRPAFLAGRWYPDDPGECRQAIEIHAREGCEEQGSWHGLVGPHAGWTFSGDAAGRGYRSLAESHADADLVVVFGSHRGPHDGSTIFRGDGWETPLGLLQTCTALASHPRVAELDLGEEPVEPLRADNAVELHLPFVRHFFARAELLMIGVEASNAAIDIGRAVGLACSEAGRRAVFIGSTDLTHYGPNYGFSPHGEGDEALRWALEVNDRGFLDHVCAKDSAALLKHGNRCHSACCPGAVAAALEAVQAYAPEHGQTPVVASHCSSHDVHPASSFVGYGTVLF